MSEDPSTPSTTPSLHLAIRCLDLTSLEGNETKEQVVELCERAIRPDPEDPSIPSVAAVVLYPSMVSVAANELGGSGVRIASVAGFPAAEGPLEERLAEIRRAVADGADEVDIVLKRPLFLSGRVKEAAEEIRLAREAAGSSTLKVILETGALQTAERIRDAATIAMKAGAQFIKSSTGKVRAGVTLDAALVMMEAARDFHRETGTAVGIKVSGGVRTSTQAISYVDLLESTLGPDWRTPELFRIGASSLLYELVNHARVERSDG